MDIHTIRKYIAEINVLHFNKYFKETGREKGIDFDMKLNRVLLIDGCTQMLCTCEKNVVGLQKLTDDQFSYNWIAKKLTAATQSVAIVIDAIYQ